MRKVLKNQKSVSAIVALALGVMVTLAGINSYGVTANESDLVFDFDEAALMERAIADLEEEEFMLEEEVAMQTIKIYNGSDVLIETVYLSDGEQIEDVETQKLLNQAEYLTGYGDTQVYRVSE